MTWNYRVSTSKNEHGRVFGIIEVYYDKKHKADGHSDPETFSPLSGWENYKYLKATYETIKEAFKQPILDLDNWPNEYKEKK